MNLRDDDEDLFISRSNEDAFKNPDKAKKEAREQKAKSKGRLLDLQKMLLKKQVQKDPDVQAARADAETKRLRKQQDEEEKSETFGTKTHKQMEEEAVLDVQDSASTEEMQQREQEGEEQKKQSGQEYADDEA